MRKKKGFWAIAANMKDYEELDDQERDSVKMGMIWGWCCGTVVMFLVMGCVATLIVYAIVTQGG